MTSHPVWQFTGFLTRVRRRVSLVEKDILTFPEYLSSSRILSLVLGIVWDCSLLLFRPFSNDHCIVYDDFWLPLLYLICICLLVVDAVWHCIQSDLVLLSLLFIFVLRKRNKWIVMFYMHAVIRLVVHHLLYMVSYPCSINPNRSFENGIRHACTGWPKHNTSYNKLLVSFCQCKRLRTEIKILGNALSRSWLSCLCPVVHLLQHTYILCSFRI
jgi:hypothetical protein